MYYIYVLFSALDLYLFVYTHGSTSALFLMGGIGFALAAALKLLEKEDE